MASLEVISEKIRAALDASNDARDEALSASREIIRSCANSIRAAHRGEIAEARQSLEGVQQRLGEMSERLLEFPEIYAAGYVHDCQKEYAEARAFIAIITDGELPDPDDLGVEYPAYLKGLGEAVGELRRHTLDVMRTDSLARAEALLARMDEIYYTLVTFDYPDALTGGLRRTTDSTRGIIEKTRGELTTALRQDELRDAIQAALQALSAGAADE